MKHLLKSVKILIYSVLLVSACAITVFAHDRIDRGQYQYHWNHNVGQYARLAVRKNVTDPDISRENSLRQGNQNLKNCNPRR